MYITCLYLQYIIIYVPYFSKLGGIGCDLEFIPYLKTPRWAGNRIHGRALYITFTWQGAIHHAYT